MKRSLISYFHINSGIAYNDIVQAYLTYLVAEGLTQPSAATLSAMNTLTESIGSTIWGLLDIFYVMALNDVLLTDAYRVNLKTPASNLITSNGAIVYNVSGPQGDGVSAYLDTNFNPATAGGNYTLNSAHRIMWVYQQDAVAPLIIDGNVNGGVNVTSAANVTTQRINCSTLTNLDTSVNMSGTGYRSINRSSNTNVQLYTDLTKFDRTQASSSLNSANQYLFRTGTNYSTPIVSFYTMGGNLSEAQHNIVRNAMAAYLVELGL